jgi:hypothetical protein
MLSFLLVSQAAAQMGPGGGDISSCLNCRADQECISGFCVTVTDPCNNECTSTETCIEPRFGTPYCWGPDSACDACTTTVNAWCNFGVCETWNTELDSGWQDLISNTDVDSSTLTTYTIYGTDRSVPEDGIVRGDGGEIISFDSSISRIDSLRFEFCNSSSTDCTNTTGSFLVENGTRMELRELFSNFTDVAVLLGRDSISRYGRVEISRNSSVSFSLDANGTVEVGDLAIEGTMVVSGDGNCLVNGSESRRGLLIVNGDVRLSGDTGNVTVEVTSTWSYSALMRVEDTLRSSGNWLGTGNITVDGNLTFDGNRTICMPRLFINNGSETTSGVAAKFSSDRRGTVRINSTDFVGGDVDIRGELIIRYSSENATRFSEVTACTDGAEIVIEVEELDTFLEVVGRRSLMRYSNSSRTADFECTVVIKDDQGDEYMIEFGDIANSSTVARRRLLSTTDVCAEWGEESLDMGECAGTNNPTTTPTDPTDPIDGAAAPILSMALALGALLF